MNDESNFKLGRPKVEPDPDARQTIIDMLVSHPGEVVTMDQFVGWCASLGRDSEFQTDLIFELQEPPELIRRTDNVKDDDDDYGVMAWRITDRTMVLDRWTTE